MATLPSSMTSGIPGSVNGTTHGIQPSSSADITGTLMVITPQMAADLLKTRLPNRPISKARIRLMINDLRSGRWVVNGESIVLDQDLRLLDGQHRLLACQESGVAIETVVIFGVAPDALPSIDQGRAKVGSDMLHMVGLSSAKELAATGRWLYRFEHQCMRAPSIALRHSDLPAYVQGKPALPTALPWGRLLRDLLPQSCASMLYFVMSAKDTGLAKRFFDALAHGDALKRDHPAHVARERLLRDKSPKNHAGILSRASLLVLAWNCVRVDRHMSGSLTWKGVTDPTAEFPEVV